MFVSLIRAVKKRSFDSYRSTRPMIEWFALGSKKLILAGRSCAKDFAISGFCQSGVG
jgi:hypothetical protein